MDEQFNYRPVSLFEQGFSEPIPIIIQLRIQPFHLTNLKGIEGSGLCSVEAFEGKKILFRFTLRAYDTFEMEGEGN